MAIVLPKSVFYHMPKTGGSWIAEGLWTAFQSSHIHVPDGHGHSSPIEYDAGDKPSFCFVRHPITWYKSYLNSGSGEIKDMIDDQYLTKLYKKFNGCDYVGKFEFLEKDLKRILDTIGEDYESDYLFGRPHVNVSQGPDLDEETKSLIRTKEAWVFRKFNYQ